MKKVIFVTLLYILGVDTSAFAACSVNMAAAAAALSGTCTYTYTQTTGKTTINGTARQKVVQLGSQALIGGSGTVSLSMTNSNMGFNDVGEPTLTSGDTTINVNLDGVSSLTASADYGNPDGGSNTVDYTVYDADGTAYNVTGQVGYDNAGNITSMNLQNDVSITGDMGNLLAPFLGTPSNDGTTVSVYMSLIGQ